MRILIAALIFISSVGFGKTVSLSIGSAWAKAGWTVEIPLTLSGGAEPAALRWSFKYSSDVSGVTVSAGVATKAAGKTLRCSENVCLVFGVNKNALADGVVAVATFQIAANPSSSTIEIVVSGVSGAGGNGGSIPGTGSTGKITLPSSTPPLQAFLKLSPESTDEPYMERRLHPRAQVHFETKVTSPKTGKTGVGSTCDISESGISVVVPFELSEGDLVQMEMADSHLFGRVAYSKAEGSEFRVGIEVQRIELGNSDLSSLLQQTLEETMPAVPGVDHVEHELG